ncbi:MAG: hypothetical protein ABIF84_00860 [Patescibacteria group bacterium]
MNSLQRKTVIIITISLAGLVLVIGLAVLPLIDKIKNLSQEYLNNQTALAQLDQKEILLKELEQYYQEKEKDLSVINQALLDSQETVGFISTLENIARQTGNLFEIKTAESIIPLEGEENQDNFLNLRISLWGNFSNLLIFLANLENNPYPPYRLLEIDSISITRLSEENASRLDLNIAEGTLETILGIKIYTQ